ncbi:hypothetical protein Bcep1808_4497 [Burkholderia vietnamiensis G4]|uniref:Uncharacterized protein n=2 Tax=Burkholderia cepacia complex TaxID=87882 RepID=A4JMF8_BURVG|nr:hypothetical protein Bcep1808_4497 [Burkholderia vietnamiensis G4]
MRALAIKVGAVEWYEAGDSVCLPDGDTIACCQSSIGHMPEPIHYDDMVEYLVSVSPAKILKLIDAFEAAEREREKLRAELEAAAADKRDAERYRALREFGKDGVNMKPPVEHVHAMLYSHLAGTIPASRVITGDELDRAIDAALGEKNANHSDK